MQCKIEPENFEGIHCEVFEETSANAMALSVLVIIELLNSLNSISENQSLLVMSPLKNLWLIGAIIVSLALHFVILYVDILALIFQVTPLNTTEWIAVLKFSFPVIILDEVLKYLSRVQGNVVVLYAFDVRMNFSLNLFYCFRCCSESEILCE